MVKWINYPDIKNSMCRIITTKCIFDGEIYDPEILVGEEFILIVEMVTQDSTITREEAEKENRTRCGTANVLLHRMTTSNKVRKMPPYISITERKKVQPTRIGNISTDIRSMTNDDLENRMNVLFTEMDNIIKIVESRPRNMISLTTIPERSVKKYSRLSIINPLQSTELREKIEEWCSDFEDVKNKIVEQIMERNPDIECPEDVEEFVTKDDMTDEMKEIMARPPPVYMNVTINEETWEKHKNETLISFGLERINN